MKLRIRCFETKETIKIEVQSSSCTLQELKNRISQALPSSLAPNFIHLSLNRKNELQSSEEDTLQSIGITSGDLIFITQNPIGFSISTETHIPKLKKSDTQIVKESETVKKLGTQIVQKSEIVKEMDSQINQSEPHETKTQNSIPGGVEMEEFMEVDDNEDYSDMNFMKSFTVPGLCGG